MKEILDEPENDHEEKNVAKSYLEMMAGLMFAFFIILVGIFLPFLVLLILFVVLSWWHT